MGFGRGSRRMRSTRLSAFSLDLHVAPAAALPSASSISWLLMICSISASKAAGVLASLSWPPPEAPCRSELSRRAHTEQWFTVSHLFPHLGCPRSCCRSHSTRCLLRASAPKTQSRRRNLVPDGMPPRSSGRPDGSAQRAEAEGRVRLPVPRADRRAGRSRAVPRACAGLDDQDEREQVGSAHQGSLPKLAPLNSFFFLHFF